MLREQLCIGSGERLVTKELTAALREEWAREAADG